MLEHVAHMGPMLVLAALLVGWAAEAASHRGGFGLVPDMGLGLIGSVLVGVVFWTVVSGDTGMLMMFVIGCVGAALAVVAQRMLWRSSGAAATAASTP